ncbi:MAG TPA: hypothetical protein VKA47_11025 [Solirubrobacterales bacterium]|nr:hypothetical protein [Solirubrobacterales bacterium]
MKNLTRKQTEMLGFLGRHYPQGISTDDPGVRGVCDSLIERGDESGVHTVELRDNDEMPTGDCYRLTDPYAEAWREESEEQARGAENN